MLNECEIDKLVDDYLDGLSIPDLSKKTGFAKSTIRSRLVKRNVMRSLKEASILAGKQGKKTYYGDRKPFSQNTKNKMSDSAKKRWHGKAKGTSLKPSGYIEYTTGEHKGRSVHVVLIEKRIGRKLKSDEIVHHIDGVKTNNSENNLALMTRSAHTRLHRFEDKISGNHRERDENGRFC